MSKISHPSTAWTTEVIATIIAATSITDIQFMMILVVDYALQTTPVWDGITCEANDDQDVKNRQRMCGV